MMKQLDRVAGAMLVRVLPQPRRAVAPHEKIRRILLIRPGGIGDAVHLVPSVRALLDRLPHLAIDILAERRNAGAFALCQGIGKVYHYDRPAQLLRVLRNRYDVVIDTEQWHRLSAVVARLVKAGSRIGYATNERARLFSCPVAYHQQDYEADSFLRLLVPLGVSSPATASSRWLDVPGDARQVVESLLRLRQDAPLIVLFPGGSIAERRWDKDRFRAVAKWCIARGLQVAVVGGAEDRQAGEHIVGGLDALNLAGRTSLAQTAAILDRAAVVVSGDSGVLHLAVGMGRATVSLFGPGIAAKWAPRGARHIVLNRHLPCSPCTRFGYTPDCTHGVACMNEITVDEVTAAVDALLERAKGSQ